MASEYPFNVILAYAKAKPNSILKRKYPTMKHLKKAAREGAFDHLAT